MIPWLEVRESLFDLTGILAANDSQIGGYRAEVSVPLQFKLNGKQAVDCGSLYALDVELWLSY